MKLNRWMFVSVLAVSFLLDFQSKADELLDHVYCQKDLRFLAPIDSSDRRKYAPDRKFDILHLAIDVTPDFDGRTVAGTTTITFKPIAKALPELHLDAVDLTVSQLESSAAVQAWQVTREAIIVTFVEALLPGQEATVTIKHSAQPELGMYFRTPAMGYLEGETHLFTQGEPIEARHWYPCFDSPNERFSSEVTCRVPEGMIVLSNGHLLSQETDDESGLVAFRWLQDKPHVNYLISVVAGYFAKVEDRYRDIPMAFYTPPSQIAQAQNSFQDTKAMMAFFEEEIGIPYPWAKYDQVCVNDFVTGGMENTSLTSLTDSTLFPDSFENLRSSQGLVAHELAHQWFGDLVTCKDWSHLWLNEGFATYYDALFDEHKNGHDSFLYEMYRNASRFIENPNDATPIVWREFDEPDDQFSFRAYPKAGWVLHMLRSQLGPVLFRHCVKTYLERHQYDVVVTEDLNSVIEELSGRSFDQFFDQWLYHGGHPDLGVRYSWDEKSKLAKISVSQNQKLGEGVLLFRFPLTIQFKFESEIHRRAVEIKEKSADFYFKLPEAPKIVRVDPDYSLLARIKLNLPNPMLYAQIEDESDMMGRLFAVKALAGKKSNSAIAKLKNRLNSDTFHGVRREASRALRSIHTPEALAALLDSSEQPDARVRQQVVSDIGVFFDDSAYEFAIESIAHEANPMIVASALRSLGGYGNDDIKPALLEFLGRESYRNVLADAAIGAIRAQDDSDYVMPLLETLMKREVEFTSSGFGRGLSALAHLARDEENKTMIREFIAGKLTHPKRRVRSAAIRALSNLGDPKAIAPLEKLATAGRGNSERRAAEDAIRSLRAVRKPGDDLRNLRNEIMDLKNQNRDLRLKFDDLNKKLDALISPENDKGNDEPAATDDVGSDS